MKKDKKNKREEYFDRIERDEEKYFEKQNNKTFQKKKQKTLSKDD